jgi:hypothetical protein
VKVNGSNSVKVNGGGNNDVYLIYFFERTVEKEC